MNNKNPKIIFLDFDGVLNSEKYPARWDKVSKKLPLAPQHVEILNRITEQTGAKIVVSSAWRNGASVRKLKKELREADVTASVIGKTPELNKYTPGGIWTGVTRGTEIQAWLDDHKHNTFVIVDDCVSDMGNLSHYVVKTEHETGLTEDHIGPIVKILTRENNETEKK